MTNNTATPTRRQLRASREAVNALAFVVDSVIDGNIEDLSDISHLDYDSLLEFADQYETTTAAIHTAVANIRNVVSFLSAE